jgi:hypothetical protein
MKKYKGVDVPKYIKMYEMHHIAMSLDNISDDIRRKISNKRSFPITTLERFYGDSYAREWLGIKFDTITGEVKAPKTKLFDKVYSRVITDIVEEKATSRKQLETEETRRIYIDGIIKELANGKKVKGINLSGSEKFKEKKLPKEIIGAKLSPLAIKSTLKCSGVERVLYEVENIEYKKFPNATADMLRTFLEIVLKAYLKKISQYPKPTRGKYVFLEDVLTKMETILSSQKNDTESVGLPQVIGALKKQKWYLEAINHNPDVFAIENTVEDAWDQMKPLIEYVFLDYKKVLEQKNVNTN